MASSILYPPKTPAAGGRGGEEAASKDGLAALWQLYEDVTLADRLRFTSEANLFSSFDTGVTFVCFIIVNCPLVAGCYKYYNSTSNRGVFPNNWRRSHEYVCLGIV